VNGPLAHERGGRTIPSGDLGRVVDAYDIEQVFVRYFDRVDANDPEGASRLFDEHVEVEIMTGKRYTGRERFARALGRVLDHYERTSHHVGNVRCDIDGDRAAAVAYVYAFHRMADTGEPWHLWARIEDRLERRPEGWIIVEHILRGLDAVPSRSDIADDWYVEHAGRLRRKA
jgi:hypothetical protein